MPRVFLSYQTKDKAIAGRIKELLAEVNVDAFLAHEDIEVSEEWRLRILEEIGKAKIFICLLSEGYMKSAWCIQESGIAAFRTNMGIIPYSLDGTIPPGFLGHKQSGKLDPNNINSADILNGIIKCDFEFGIGVAIEELGKAVRFRAAEFDFEFLLPYLPRMTDEQKRRILELSASNSQVRHASKCATVYIPPLLASHGHLITEEQRKSLTSVIAQYRKTT